MDCSPNATPMFEGRRGGEDIEAEISSLFQRLYGTDGICDLEKLCVVKNSWCWAIYIDIMSKQYLNI